jgi:large subunit ribosomal protein L14e
MTDLLVKMQKNPRQKTLTKAWADQDIQGKWDSSAWAKKLVSRKKRASLTDFDRFKVMVAKKQKTAIITKKLAELTN